MQYHSICHLYRRPHRSRVAQAFTLVEMLVVIAIITILLTIGALGLKNLSKNSGVSAGLPLAEALFAEARAIAIGKGTKARVLIHANHDSGDELHRERYLNYMAIAFETLDADGVPTGTWEIASTGTKLPSGVYFMKDLSETNAPTLPEMTIMLPGRKSSRCFYYEFNAEGLISDPAPAANLVPRFVIQSGSLPPDATEPQVGTGKNMGGFVIWRSGRTSLFRHPEQIEP